MASHEADQAGGDEEGIGPAKFILGVAVASAAYVFAAWIRAERGSPAQALCLKGAWWLAVFGGVPAALVWRRAGGLWLPRERLVRDAALGVCLATVMAAMHGLAAKLYVERALPTAMRALPHAAYHSAGIDDVLLIALGAGILAPVGEEIFFRGFLYVGLKRYLGRWLAIAASALAFGLLHAPGMRLTACLLGVAAAVSYERTRSLLPPVMMHVGANLSFVLFIANGAQVASRVPYALLVAAFALMSANLFVCGRALFAGAD